MGVRVYPAHGWLNADDSVEWNRDDQGKDFVSRKRLVQAPGAGVCVGVGSDAPFPNGFGPSYPLVRLDTGAFAGHTWYIGHNTSNVRTGERFSFGHTLSFANQGINFEGTHGGWIELGTVLPGGSLGPNTHGAPHWYTSMLMQPLVVKVPDPAVKFGDHGLRVWGISRALTDCGWLKHPYITFNRPVHGAVVAFQKHHKLKPDGMVGPITDLALKHAAAWCRKHHRKEH